MITAEITGGYAGRYYSSPEGAVAATYADLVDINTRIIPNALKRAMNDYLKLIAGRLVARHSTPWPGGTGLNKLSRRSGAGVDSIKSSVKVDAGIQEIVGRIGGIWYLGVHEYGATIRAKRAKYLTIPLPAAMNSQGIPLKRRARDWAGTFIMKSRKGNLLIFQKRGNDIVPLYVLKKSVKIPARLGMRKELKAYTNLLFKFIEQDLIKEFKL